MIMKQDKFTEADVGKYIFVKDGDFSMIGIVGKEFHIGAESDGTTFRGHTTHRIDSNKGDCMVETSWCYMAFDRYWAEATSEQKHWLDECIKANKYISEEEAMKTFDLISSPLIFN